MMIQKREIFRSCFDNFDFDKVAEYDEEGVQRILETEGMIRSRRKIDAAIYNARRFQEIRREFGSFSDYIWGFAKGKIYSVKRLIRALFCEDYVHEFLFFGVFLWHMSARADLKKQLPYLKKMSEQPEKRKAAKEK